MFLVDVFGEAVRPGDFLLDERGYGLLVIETESSFIRQSIQRIRRVTVSSRGMRVAENHRYVQPQFCLRVREDEIKSREENKLRYGQRNHQGTPA